MKKITLYLVKSILAGIMIAIGGTIFLSLENKVIGASLFSIGLFMILIRGFNLFTGKIGYLLDNDAEFSLEVLITLIGNFIGTNIAALLLRLTRIYKPIHEYAQKIIKVKLDDNILSLLILGIFCGILMYLAVDNFKTNKDKITGSLSVYLCVTVFILCGFEHSIADMYYFAIAGSYSLKTFLYLFAIIIGNSVGGLLIPFLKRIIRKNI